MDADDFFYVQVSFIRHHVSVRLCVFNILDYLFVSSLSAVRRNFDKRIKHDDFMALMC